MAMADEHRRDAMYLVAGFVIGSLTFGVLLLLVSKSLSLLRGAPQGLLGPGSPSSGWIGSPMAPQTIALPATTARPAYEGLSHATRADTVALGEDFSVRVFSAPHNGPMWRVRLHVLGPAGSFGMFSLDAPIMPGAGFSAPGSVTVPSGSYTEVRMTPRQAMYGLGANGAGIQVSYTASAEA